MTNNPYNPSFTTKRFKFILSHFHSKTFFIFSLTLKNREFFCMLKEKEILSTFEYGLVHLLFIFIFYFGLNEPSIFCILIVFYDLFWFVSNTSVFTRRVFGFKIWVSSLFCMLKKKEILLELLGVQK